MDIDGEVDLRMEAEGPGSWEPRTVFQVLEETVSKYNDRPALRYKREGSKVGPPLNDCSFIDPKCLRPAKCSSHFCLGVGPFIWLPMLLLDRRIRPTGGQP